MKAGYREGISAGRLSTMQNGFDQGYAVGAPLGRQVGELRGVAASLLAYLTSSTSTGKSAAATISSQNIVDDTARKEVVEKTRDLIRRLGKLRLKDLAPRDHEAEQHAIDHGEELQVPQDLQDKRDMEALEDSMNGLGGSKTQQHAPKLEELQACRAELRELLNAVGLQALQI